MHLYFIFGLPGAGKGVCAQKLKIYKNFIHFSLGDFLRNHVRKGTKLGCEYSDEILSGVTFLDCDLVSDLVIQEIDFAIKLSNNMVIDGFPRTIKQLNIIEGFLEKKRITPKWIFFDTDSKTAILRLLNRKHCAECGIDFILIKTFIANKCDYCKSDLIKRSTDNKKDILRRCEVFYNTTYNVIKNLDSRNLLTRFDSGGCLEEFSNKFIKEF